MANSKISALTAATTPLAGTEVLPIVQSSATVKVSVDNLTTGKTVTADKFYAPSTGVTPVDARRTVANNTCLAQIVDSPSTSNCNYLITGIDTTGGTVGYASGGAFVSTGANGTGTARPLILHTYGNNDIVFARQNTQIGSVSANGFKPIAAKGVDFSANTPAAGMTSQLLNWYEEGTWTPVIKGSGTAGTYELNTGVTKATYTRIGRVVYLSAYIVLANPITGGGTGDLTITGLPFSKGANFAAWGTVALSGVDYNNGANLACYFGTTASSSTLYIWETNDNAGVTLTPISAVAAGDVIGISIAYEV